MFSWIVKKTAGSLVEVIAIQIVLLEETDVTLINIRLFEGSIQSP